MRADMTQTDSAVKRNALVCSALLSILAAGCALQLGYRHFAGPVVPAAEYDDQFAVGDDRSVTFIQDRLEVTMLPLTAEMMNRQLSSHSESTPGFSKANPYVTPTNPYTYGDWTPLGEDASPERFTLFALKVKNYAYPKVRIDPASIEIVAPNGRHYPALTISSLVEYYWPYAVAYSGNNYRQLRERTDLLRRTMYRDDMIFSGQEKQGYVVFEPLHRDVEEFTIHIRGMQLRFDYRGDPVETVDIAYRFDREVHFAKEPPAEG
jgi:hypothetical protein